MTTIPKGLIKATEDGFVQLTCFEKIQYAFSLKHRAKFDQSVHDRLVGLFNNPESTINKTSSLQKQIFLQNNVAHISQRQFKRSALKDTHFYKELSKDLKNFYEADVIDALFWDKVAEGQIAEWSGIHMKRNSSGTSGNYKVRDLSKNIIGLYKPISESPHAENNPHFWIRVRNKIQKLISSEPRCTHEELGHISEEYASRVNDKLNWKDANGEPLLVPTTRQVKMQSNAFVINNALQKGSFQIYLNNSVDGYHKFNIRGWLPAKLSAKFLPSDEEKLKLKFSEESFQRFAFLQGLIGNRDCNIGNLMFKKNNTNAYGVDASSSMPFKEPSGVLDFFSAGHLWSSFVYAKKPVPQHFKDEARDNKDYFVELAKELYPEYAKDGICNQLIIRMDKIINSDDTFTWEQFAKI